jgi:trehalose 6-phosphate synthase
MISATDIGWWTRRYLAALAGVEITGVETAPPLPRKRAASSAEAVRRTVRNAARSARNASAAPELGAHA